MPGSAATGLGACPTVLDWNATNAATGQYVLSGVLAGFVFGGIVAVLSTKESRNPPEAARALKLLFSAFFGLAVTAYLFADLSGDNNCLRAQSEEVLVGGLLGTFAIIMIVALTWLIVAYGLYADGVLRFLRGLIYVASGFVVGLLCTSSYTYLDAVLPHGTSNVVPVSMYVIGGPIWLAAVLAESGAARRLRIRAIRNLKRANYSPGSTNGNRTTRSSAVDWCAWAALGYLAAASFADSFVLASSESLWRSPRLPGIYAVAWSSLLVPLVVLVLALRALALDPKPDEIRDGDINRELANPEPKIEETSLQHWPSPQTPPRHTNAVLANSNGLGWPAEPPEQKVR
jgi:hypothetical protein